MERLSGMLSIKNDFTIFRDIAIYNGEPIDVGHDNEFNNQQPVESEPKCFIKPWAWDAQRYLWNQAEIHRLKFGLKMKSR